VTQRLDDHRPVNGRSRAAGSALAANPTDSITRLAQRYTFRRPDEVAAFLHEHPRLSAVLLEASDVIPDYFGHDAPLFLEVFTDPETEPDARELFAIVRTSMEPDEAVARLDRLDEEWWLDASSDESGVLVVSIEFG